MAWYLNSKMVMKDDYIGLNCLVRCINFGLIFYLLYQNVAKFCAFRQTVWDSKSHYIGQFPIFCSPGDSLGKVLTIMGRTENTLFALFGSKVDWLRVFWVDFFGRICRSDKDHEYMIWVHQFRVNRGNCYPRKRSLILICKIQNENLQKMSGFDQDHTEMKIVCDYFVDKKHGMSLKYLWLLYQNCLGYTRSVNKTNHPIWLVNIKWTNKV